MYHLRPYSKTGNVVIESLSLLSLAGIFSLPDQRPKSTNKGRFVNINYFYHLGIFLWLNTIWLTNVSQIRKIRPRLSIYCLCHARNNFLWFFPKFFSNANCLCGVLKYLASQGTPNWSDHVMATPFLFIILFTIHKYLWTRFEIKLLFIAHREEWALRTYIYRMPCFLHFFPSLFPLSPSWSGFETDEIRRKEKITFRVYPFEIQIVLY